MKTLLLVAACVAPSIAVAEPFSAKIYEKGSNKSKHLFNLVRKEHATGPTLRATATFTDPQGAPVVSEEAITEGGKVVKYTLDHHQLGEKGSLEVRDGKAHFTYAKGGKTKTDEEDAKDNLIIGPTTTDYLKANWSKILAGEDVSVRFAVLDRLETVGFKYFKIGELERDGKKLVQVKMKPTSFIIASIVDPLIFTMERDSARLVELNGRVLPKRKAGDSWKDLDAETVYSY